MCSDVYRLKAAHLFLLPLLVDCKPSNQSTCSVFVPVECHLCYNKTKSTPGFAADPNTCQRFVMCEPDGMGGWNTFNMTCPMCTFWNQDLLTCVQVYDGPGCMQTHVTDYLNYTTPSQYTFSIQTFQTSIQRIPSFQKCSTRHCFMYACVCQLTFIT